MVLASVKLKVNGTEHEVTNFDTRSLLVDLLRERLRLTGTHVGCLTGNCGACTVLLNDSSAKSCTILGVQTNGAEVITVEGLLSERGDSLKERLHPIQKAFIDNHGLQCGYCTPGMIISAYQLLKRNPHPTKDEIKLGIAGNLCRCTGYTNIIRAIAEASKSLSK